MDVALFIPCYVDQFYPRVGLATAEVLERHGVTVHFPEAQTCCGQPMANSGFFDDARPLARKMLEGIDGLQLVELARADECCGFGGTFAVTEEAVSCAMGRDRIADHERAGAELIAGGDVSCLMHLEGLIRRDGKKLRVLHVAELLEEATR